MGLLGGSSTFPEGFTEVIGLLDFVQASFVDPFVGAYGVLRIWGGRSGLSD